MKVFVANPIYREVTLAHHNCMMELQRYFDAAKFDVVFGGVAGDADIGRARSVAASAFLRSDGDVLLTIDADIVFKPLDALRLCLLADKGFPVVGGLYKTRTMTEVNPAQLLETGQDIVMLPGEKAVPVPVRYLATGFMAVHRSVFERLTKVPDPILGEPLPLCMQNTDYPFWPFFLQGVIPWERDGHLYLSEDYAFCHRARAAGFDIHVDPSIRLGHIGHYEYTMPDLLRRPTNKELPMHLKQTEDGRMYLEEITSEVLAASSAR